MKTRFAIISIILGIALVFGGLAATAPPVQSLIQASKTRADIVEQAQKAVVHLKVEKASQPHALQGHQNPFGAPEEFFKRFFPGSPKGSFPAPPQQRGFKQQGQGSGVIISEDGYILTNNHVVGGANKISVQLNNGREFSGKIIGADALSDIAVIKIEGEDFPHLPFGNSDDIRIGETVIAIGNPFGLSNTVTMGIVSAKGRSNIGLVDYENFIQTDAAINPGNSGGPLINLEGGIVGINTAIFSQSGGYQGIGFSVPINMAKHIMQELVKKGNVSRGWLGVHIQDITPDLAQAFDLEHSKGSLVAKVVNGSPAQKAGLQRGDVIVSFNESPIQNSSDLRNKVGMAQPNTKAALQVFRKGTMQEIAVDLGVLPSSSERPQQAPETNFFGLELQNLTPELAEKLNHSQDSGVLITQVKPDSMAQQAGLKAGLIIQEVNQQQVRDIESFQTAVNASDLKDGVLLLVASQNGSRYVILKSE